MLPKESKKNKTSNYKVSSFAPKIKKLDNYTDFNKHSNKNKNSKNPMDNNIKNNNKNINLDGIINAKDKDKKKKNMSKYNTKSNNEKSTLKIDSLTKQKTPNKIIPCEKKIQINQIKHKKNNYAIENRKSPLLRSKTYFINDKKTNDINNEKKTKEINHRSSKKLIDFLKVLTPIDTSKFNKLLSKNINKILELENQVKTIVKTTEDDIKAINDKENKNIGNNEENKISLEQNIEIIEKESNMRKEIYKLLFNFITDLLEQINKLSNNIANQEIIDLNNLPKDRNILLPNNNNNGSIESNNSLFISEIQEDFCGKLINLTKSFMNSDIDLSEIKFENNDDIKNNYQKIGKNFDDNLFNDDDDFDYYKNLLKNKKTTLMHPNEILNKIQKIDPKDKKIIHHYSNSLKVNSNLEKLEEKVNNDEGNISIEQFGTIKNIIQTNNCSIY